MHLHEQFENVIELIGQGILDIDFLVGDDVTSVLGDFRIDKML